MKNLLLIALSTVTVSAHAWEPDIYVGANGAAWQYSHNMVGTSATINSLEGVAGLRLAKYIAVEARFGLGMNTGRNDKTTIIPLGLPDDPETSDVDESLFYRSYVDSYEVEATGYASFYFKPVISNSKASLYGLLGFTTVQLEQVGTQTGAFEGDTPPIGFDDTEGDLSYGVGVSFQMNETTELTAEWKKLVNAGDFDMRGGSLGFIYQF